MKPRNKRILVTGGAGFIGSHEVKLLAEDNSVTVLDDCSVGSRENLDAVRDTIEIREGDVAERATVSDAARGCKVVFLLAVGCLRVVSDPLLGLRDAELGFRGLTDFETSLTMEIEWVGYGEFREGGPSSPRTRAVAI